MGVKHSDGFLIVVVFALAFVSLKLPTLPVQNAFYIAAVAVAYGLLFDLAWWRVAGAAVSGATISLAWPYFVNPLLSQERQLLIGLVFVGGMLVYAGARLMFRHGPTSAAADPSK